MNDDTLLLRLRAETLKANLIRLKDHRPTPDRIQDLGQLREARQDVESSVRSMEKALAGLRDKLYRGGPISLEDEIDDHGPTPKTVGCTMDDMQQKLSDARSKLLALHQIIVQMETKCFEVTRTQVGAEIIKNLQTKANARILELADIPTASGEDQDLARAWEKLLEEVTPETEPIFRDYMELLGGAALRDAGFDGNISSFTDELLSRTERNTPMSARTTLLALPMRRQALVKTIKQIIRVTFPNWTVWALPSAAFELWMSVGNENVKKTLYANLTGHQAEKQKLTQQYKKCLGDVYATYTMGPAYAYYAVGLLLEPNLEEDQYRVRAILTMLEVMEEWPVAPRYLGVRRQLLNAWNAARRQRKRPTLDVDVERPQSAEQSDPDGSGVRGLIGAFRKALDTETSAKFGTEIWNQSRPWVVRLVENTADQIDVPAGVELRHFLNAAWLARCDPSRDTNLDLNLAVKALQQKIKDRQRKDLR